MNSCTLHSSSWSLFAPLVTGLRDLNGRTHSASSYSVFVRSSPFGVPVTRCTWQYHIPSPGGKIFPSKAFSVSYPALLTGFTVLSRPTLPSEISSSLLLRLTAFTSSVHSCISNLGTWSPHSFSTCSCNRAVSSFPFLSVFTSLTDISVDINILSKYRC